MSLDPVGEGLHLAGSITDLAKDILDRNDRDSLNRDYDEKLVKIQNFFANNEIDSDDFRRFVDRLCNDAGKPLTPTGDVSTGKREYLHASLLAFAELAYLRRVVARLVAQKVK